MNKELEKEIKRVNASFNYFCRQAERARTAKTLAKWIRFMNINSAYSEKIVKGFEK